MISISTTNNQFDCDNCGYPNKQGNHVLVDIKSDNMLLCADCAETIGIMLNDLEIEEVD